jgi:hypothetical protein
MDKKEIHDNLENRKNLYSTIIYIGKNHLFKFKSHIDKFLSDNDTTIKMAAIRVLTAYWADENYKNYALDMYKKETDEELRSYSLGGWASFYRKSMNHDTLTFLYEIIRDKNLAEIIRATAYQNFFYCSNRLPKDWPNTDIDWDNFDAEIDWDLLKKILQEAQ